MTMKHAGWAAALAALGLIAFTSASAQVITTSTFNQGAGIVIANEEPDLPHAELATTGFIDEFSINIDTSENNEGLLRFENLFGDGPGQIPVGRQILRADIRLRTYDAGDGGEFYRLLTPFDPATDTWNEWGNGAEPRNFDPSVQHDGFETVEQFELRVVGPFGSGGAPSITRGDVTESVRAWAEAADPNAANFGWHIDAFDSGGWGFWNFDHPDESLRPQLTVWHSDTAATVLNFRQGENGYMGTLDTVIKQSDPDTPLGSDLTLESDGSDGEGGTIYSLLRFDDIVGGAAGQIPVDAQLVKATLSLSVFSEGGDGVEIRRMQSAWDEDSTWSSIAADAGVALELADGRATFHEIEQGSRAEFDVTGSVQAWLDGAENLGWLISPLPGSSGDIHFDSADSFDSAFAPELELVFLPVAAAANVPEPSTLILTALAVAGLALRPLRRAGRFLVLAMALVSLVSGEIQAQLVTTTLTEGDGITIANNPGDPEGDANRTYLDLVAQGNPDAGEMNIDLAPINLEGFLRFNEPLFGDGPGLVPLDGFIVDARLIIQTTGNGNGASFHRALLPFDLDDTWNAWGSGSNGRNSEPGVQTDGVEAVADADFVTPFQVQGTSFLDATASVQAWQALGSAEAANEAVQLGWHLNGIGTNGWDFANFGNQNDPGPQLVVTYSDVAPDVATFRQGFNGYDGASDTWISESSPDGSFGGGPGLSVAAFDDEGGQNISLIKFENIIGDGPGQVPADATLVRAVIKFNTTESGSGVQARRMLTDWSEGATWGEIIPQGSMALTPDSVLGNASEGEARLDVTAGVQASMDGAGNFGWALVPLFNGTAAAAFESSDSGAAPQGDANDDGAVDLTDFNLLKVAFGGNDPAADFDGNGVVELADFNILKTNFGLSGAPSEGRPTLEILYIPSTPGAPVPEPSSILLALFAAAALSASAASRRRSVARD